MLRKMIFVQFGQLLCCLLDYPYSSLKVLHCFRLAQRIHAHDEVLSLLHDKIVLDELTQPAIKRWAWHL